MAHGGRAHRVLGAAGLLGAFVVASAHAQAVDIRLRDEGSGVAIPGAIVRLLADSVVVAQGLSDEVGRIVLRAPRRGTYRLRVDRIGFVGFASGPITLGPGQTVQAGLNLASIRRDLPPLVVMAESRCDRRVREGGLLAAAIWEEIQKALMANVLTLLQSPVPLRVSRFKREVSRTGEIEREWVDQSEVVLGRPFASLPPEQLARDGYVYSGRDEVTFAAPDAELLLSDDFADTHCFRAIAAAENEEMIGLAFEPIPGRRLPDVKGTLWMDRESHELRFLEYSYTGLRAPLAQADLGGRVEFSRLDNGAWIITYWHIRMPRTGLRSLRTRARGLVGYRDEGGRAEPVATSGPTHAVVAGQVFDSIAGSGLVGAVVRVHGEADSAVTDAEGRFHLRVPQGGTRTVEVRHPRVGLVGPTRHAVRLSLGDTTAVAFAVPPVSAFVRAFCGGSRGRAGLVGIGWGSDGQPAEGLTVRVVIRATGGNVVEPRFRTGPSGVFAACDLPDGEDLPVRLEQRSHLLAQTVVRLAPGEFRWVELKPVAR